MNDQNIKLSDSDLTNADISKDADFKMPILKELTLKIPTLKGLTTKGNNQMNKLLHKYRVEMRDYDGYGARKRLNRSATAYDFIVNATNESDARNKVFDYVKKNNIFTITDSIYHGYMAKIFKHKGKKTVKNTFDLT